MSTRTSAQGGTQCLIHVALTAHFIVSHTCWLTIGWHLFSWTAQLLKLPGKTRESMISILLPFMKGTWVLTSYLTSLSIMGIVIFCQIGLTVLSVHMEKGGVAERKAAWWKLQCVGGTVGSSLFHLYLYFTSLSIERGLYDGL